MGTSPNRVPFEDLRRSEAPYGATGFPTFRADLDDLLSDQRRTARFFGIPPDLS
jgi:hypothetical protein